MAEHLEAYALAVGAAEVFGLDGVVDGAHLVEVELAGEHHHVGYAGIVAHGLDVGDVALGGDVHLYVVTPAGIEYRHIRGYHGRYRGFFGCRYDFVEIFEVGVVDHCVDSEVCLDSGGMAAAHYLDEVVESEVGA